MLKESLKCSKEYNNWIWLTIIFVLHDIRISFTHSKANEEFLLSPGEHRKKVLVQHVLKRTWACEVINSNKKRRSLLKSKKQQGKEMRKGITYTSGENLGDSSMADDIHKIPPSSSLPTISTLSNINYTFIWFDLETTGLGKCFDKCRQM